MDVTAAYLSAEILTWALPLGLLIAVTIWWVVVLRRRSSSDT
jgi:cytochrome c-type biogenesis protein CcmH/NrfF